jgi:hypothetical protein
MDATGKRLLRRFKRATLSASFTLGLASVAAFLGAGDPLASVVAVVGWLMVTPTLALTDLPYFDDDLDRAESHEDPVERLRERYAAGEITGAEFDRMVDRLLATEPGGPHRPDDTVDRTETVDAADLDARRTVRSEMDPVD